MSCNENENKMYGSLPQSKTTATESDFQTLPIDHLRELSFEQLDEEWLVVLDIDNLPQDFMTEEGEEMEGGRISII